MTPGMAISRLEMEAPMVHAVVRGASADCEWRLPSGEDLISFALATGFAAGPLLPRPVEQDSELLSELVRQGRFRRRI